MRHCAAGAEGLEEDGGLGWWLERWVRDWDLGVLGWRPGVGWIGERTRQTSETLDLLYTEVLGVTCQRVCGFGYQIFKPVSKYPLGLKFYPRPCQRIQTQTRIRARRVWYPRICGFETVAILTFYPSFIPRLHFC